MRDFKEYVKKLNVPTLLPRDSKQPELGYIDGMCYDLECKLVELRAAQSLSATSGDIQHAEKALAVFQEESRKLGAEILKLQKFREAMNTEAYDGQKTCRVKTRRTRLINTALPQNPKEEL